jgi:hypothetical protein
MAKFSYTTVMFNLILKAYGLKILLKNGKNYF